MSKTAKSHITLDDFWPYQAVVLADQISRHTLSIVKSETDLNLSQWRVLAAIAEAPGRTAAEVTAITPMDKTIVSRAVSSLMTLGLATKISDTSDKRRSSLSVTAKGQKIYERVAQRLNMDFLGLDETDNAAENLTLMLRAFSDKLAALSAR